MASNPFNALMDPQQLGMGIQNAFQIGQQQRQQAETQRALGEYSQNMSPETAANVSRHNPMLGMQLQDREQQRQAQLAAQQEKEMERRITAAALQGDPQARQALAYYNADFYLKLDDRQKQAVDQGMNAIGQQAFSILQLPPEQRGPALQQALATLNAQGIDTSQFALTGDPTADLKAALAMAGKLEAWEKFAQPDYVPIGEAGLAGFQFGVPIQQNGQPQNFGVQGGQPQSAPQQPVTMPPPRAAGNTFTMQDYQSAVREYSNMGIGGPERVSQMLAQNGIAVRVSSPQEARSLPSGTKILLPDGREGVVP